MESKRYIPQQNLYEGLIKKYPTCKKEIEEAKEKISNEFNNSETAYDFFGGRKFVDKIKDFIPFIDTKPIKDIEGMKIKLQESYNKIIVVLKRYCDLKEEYYNLIALWIIGTYLHKEFPSYPFLFLNAMKGSGKTRLLKLITVLSKDGDLLSSLSEAVLFRTTGTLGIDEFEGITRKGGENLRELLNAAYKRGSKVKRMRKKKTEDGEEQVVEEFDVYRAICMANIWGMESVLGDRCLTLILEKSNNYMITRTMELFDDDDEINYIRDSLSKCSLCNVVVARNIYMEWNRFINNNYITTQTHNYIKLQLLEKIKQSNINGRHLELAMPLFLIAENIDAEVLDTTIKTLCEITESKKEDDFADNHDVSLIDFISQEIQTNQFRTMKEITHKFKEFLGDSEEWINEKWVGRALKRLALILKKKRITRGILIVPDIIKAQQRILMFK